MTNGEVLRVRAAMKPISTVPRALATIDTATGEPAVAINQRSDACAVPRGSVVMEAMVALVLADAVAGEVRRRLGRRDPPQRRGLPRRAAASGERRPLLVARRPAGVGQDDGRARRWPRALGVAFRDTDADVEAATGSTRRRPVRHRRASRTSARWRSRRSPGRSPSTTASSRSAAERCTSAATRELLVAYGRAGGTVVWLDVDLASAAKRVGLSRDRPILGVNPRAMLRHMLETRAPLYGEVATLTRAPPAAAEPGRGRRRGARRAADDAGRPMRRVPVPGDRPYEVVIGPGAQAELGLVLAGTARAAVVHAPPLAAAAGAAVETLQTAGVAAEAVVVPDGEAAKTAEVAARAWEEFGRLGLTRSDAVVGIGGGAVTDLAGFLAATWVRGVRVVQVPTSLLGMVDAAVGGKTGINTGAGKNLVGAFHPPAAVLADTDVLAGLPEAEFRSGLAEVVKCGFIADGAILDLLDADPTGRRDTAELIERAVRVKADAVGEDLYDTGRREFLNYGHTLGPRDRAGGGLRLAARRGGRRRAGVRRRAGRAGRAADPRRRRPAPHADRRHGPAHPVRRRLGRGCRRSCAWTRRPAARRCGSSSSTASATRRS